MKDRIIINFKTKWLMLAIAVCLLVGLFGYLAIQTEGGYGNYFVGFPLFVIGIAISVPISLKLLPLFARGFVLHFLRALLLLLCVCPIFWGPEPTFVPVAFVLIMEYLRNPREILDYFVLIPFNTFGPIVVFVSGYFLSIFLQMQKLEDINRKNSAIADISGE
ncbi:MAG: hypothetical protein WCJ56_07535 [bacterium]